MHGQSWLQGRHGLSALVTRSAIKMDLPDKKGIGIIGGVYGLIKGGLQKRNEQEYRDSAVRAYCPDCRHRALAQSIENNHLVPVDGYLFAVWEPDNDFSAEISDNLTVTDALAVLYKCAVCADDVCSFFKFIHGFICVSV